MTFGECQFEMRPKFQIPRSFGLSITVSYIFCALGQEQFPEAWVASRAKNVVPNKKNMIYFQALGHHWVVDVPKEELHSLMLYIN